MPNSVINRRVVLGLSGYDKDAQAYFNQLTGNVSVAFKLAINTLVLSLKADGNWNELDRLWIHAAENQQNARVSLVNPTSTAITEVNTPTWTVNQGYTGNGTTMYLNTNYNLTTNGVKYTQNNCSFGTYSRTNSAQSYLCNIGVADATYHSVMYFSAGTLYAQANTSPDTTVGGQSDDSKFFTMVRDGAYSNRVYKNGTQIATSAIVSKGTPNRPFFLLSRSINGAPSIMSDAQIALSFAGSGSVNQSSLYNAVQALGTTLGWAI